MPQQRAQEPEPQRVQKSAGTIPVKGHVQINRDYRVYDGVIYNGKENGNYYSILGLYMDNGKENGNHQCMTVKVPTPGSASSRLAQLLHASKLSEVVG